MVRAKDILGIDDILSGYVTIKDATFVGQLQVSFSTWSADSSLYCTSFLCTLIIANGIFSFILGYSIQEDS